MMFSDKIHKLKLNVAVKYLNDFHNPNKNQYFLYPDFGKITLSNPFEENDKISLHKKGIDVFVVRKDTKVCSYYGLAGVVNNDLKNIEEVLYSKNVEESIINKSTTFSNNTKGTSIFKLPAFAKGSNLIEFKDGVLIAYFFKTRYLPNDYIAKSKEKFEVDDIKIGKDNYIENLLIKDRKLIDSTTFNPIVGTTYDLGLKNNYNEKALFTLSDKKIVKDVFSVADKNCPKFEMNYVNFNMDSSRIEATDTKRLVVSDITSTMKGSLLVMKNKHTENAISIGLNNENFIADGKDYIAYGVYYNGKYPDVDRILLKNLTGRTKLTGKIMFDSKKGIKAIMFKWDDEKKQFDILSYGDTNTFKDGDKVGTFFSEKEFDSFALNYKYIDRLIEGDMITISVSEPKLPFLVKTENTTNVIMPIVI